MSAKKRPPVDPHDNPTRKVESMSSIAAELLLRDQERGFDEESGRRLRSGPPPARDMYSSTSPPPPAYGSLAPEPPPKRGLRIALLVGAAVLLVVLSVTVTLLVVR